MQTKDDDISEAEHSKMVWSPVVCVSMTGFVHGGSSGSASMHYQSIGKPVVVIDLPGHQRVRLRLVPLLVPLLVLAPLAPSPMETSAEPHLPLTEVSSHQPARFGLAETRGPWRLEGHGNYGNSAETLQETIGVFYMENQKITMLNMLVN